MSVQVRKVDGCAPASEGPAEETRSGTTPIGLPATWEFDRLSRWWEVIDCKHVTADFEASGFPVASIGEVQGRFVDLAKARCTNLSFYEQLTEGGRKPRPGDLILSRNATVGEVAQVTEWHPPFAMGQDVCLLRKRESDFSSDFLQAVLRSDIVMRQLENTMVGSTFRRVNVEQVKGLAIPFPTPDEQRAIAATLSDVDGLLGALDALIGKKRAIKQAAMQQLLTGKTRLPGHLREWSKLQLGEIGRCLRGVSYDPDHDLFPFDTENSIRLLRANNIQAAAVITADLQFISRRRVAPEQVLRPGDVVICMANGSKELVGKAGLFSIDDGNEYAFGAFMGCFRTFAPTTDVRFVSYLLQSATFRKFIGLILAGSSINNLRPSDIESAEFLLPEEAEQRAIADVLSDIDAEITALEARRDKARAIKQGMMQQLLTGCVRLVKPNRKTTSDAHDRRKSA